MKNRCYIFGLRRELLAKYSLIDFILFYFLILTLFFGRFRKENFQICASWLRCMCMSLCRYVIPREPPNVRTLKLTRREVSLKANILQFEELYLVGYKDV
jgi:hypothetical protein